MHIFSSFQAGKAFSHLFPGRCQGLTSYRPAEAPNEGWIGHVSFRWIMGLVTPRCPPDLLPGPWGCRQRINLLTCCRILFSHRGPCWLLTKSGFQTPNILSPQLHVCTSQISPCFGLLKVEPLPCESPLLISVCPQSVMDLCVNLQEPVQSSRGLSVRLNLCPTESAMPLWWAEPPRLLCKHSWSGLTLSCCSASRHSLGLMWNGREIGSIMAAGLMNGFLLAFGRLRSSVKTCWCQAATALSGPLQLSILSSYFGRIRLHSEQPSTE